MNWGLLSTWQWALLFVIPPAIVLLYFLKLRREPLEVPSTFLWHRTVEDLHVNSIWQKLRRNLLLFLQLLLVALAVLALFDLSWQGTKLTDNRFIFLIDNSASMTATDVEQRSRLEEAKLKAKAIIDSMKSGDTGLVISFSDLANTVQSFTDNHRLLKERIDSIAPTHRRTDLEQALRFAAGLANPGRTAYSEGDAAAADALPATLYILSDGRIAAQPRFSLGNLTPEYAPLGDPAVGNVAIAAFQTGRNPEKPDELQAFVRLQNYGSEPAKVEISLHLDGELVDASVVELSAYRQLSTTTSSEREKSGDESKTSPTETTTLAEGGSGGAEFGLRNTESGVLRVSIDTPDALAVDNEAFAVLDVTQRANLLLVTAGNPFLEFAMSTDRIKRYADVKIAPVDYLKSDEYKKEAAQGAYDLVLFDGCNPDDEASMPQSNTLFFGGLPPGGAWQAGEPVTQPHVIDFDRSHPLMQFLDLSHTLIAESRILTPPKPSSTLLDSDLGPLMAIAARDSFQDAVIGFTLIGHEADGAEFFNTLWPREPSFPVFMQNVLSYLGGVSEQSTSQVYRTGQMLQLRLDTPSKEVRITNPAGQTSDMPRGRTGEFTYGDTGQVGIYEIVDPAKGDVKHRVAVNLFDDIESNIAPVAELKTEFETIKATRGLERIRRELWKPFLLLALFVLIIEWYIYNRRVYL